MPAAASDGHDGGGDRLSLPPPLILYLRQLSYITLLPSSSPRRRHSDDADCRERALSLRYAKAFYELRLGEAAAASAT